MKNTPVKEIETIIWKSSQHFNNHSNNRERASNSSANNSRQNSRSGEKTTGKSITINEMKIDIKNIESIKSIEDFFDMLSSAINMREVSS